MFRIVNWLFCFGFVLSVASAAQEQQQHSDEIITETQNPNSESFPMDLEDNDLEESMDSVDNDTETRINGGQMVKQFIPYQVSLQLFRRGVWHHFCGGSIISPNHVLTAAHCVDRVNINELAVVGGTLTWRTGGDRHRILAKRTHPGFTMDPKIINDLAILKVVPPFNLQKGTIGKINLGGANRVSDRISVRLTGWGSTTPTASNGLPEHLQMLEYRTITNDECARKGFRVTRNEICAAAVKGKGACVGDSGGPLVTMTAAPQLVGIVSYGTAMCAQGRPDVYTRISSFLPFIKRVITKEIP